MKIEIDTKHDSKEEITHLANMLQAIASSSSGSRSFVRKLKPKDIVRQNDFFGNSSPSISSSNSSPTSVYDSSTSQSNISQSSSSSTDSSGSGGMFNMFGDNTSSEKSVVDNSPRDMFSDSPAQSEQSAQPEQTVQPVQKSQTGEVFSLFNTSPTPLSEVVSETPESVVELNENEESTSAQEILDDDRLMPY